MQTHELILGLIHEDFHVRSRCLSILADRANPGLEAARAATQSWMTHGKKTFEYFPSMTRLPMDEEIFLRMLTSIESNPESFGQTNTGSSFAVWLTRGPIITLREHSQRIKQLPSKAFKTPFGNTLTGVHESMTHRLMVHNLNGREALNLLDEKIKDCVTAPNFNHRAVSFLNLLVERLWEETELFPNERIREWITNMDCDSWERDTNWKAGFALLLATERKLETLSTEVINLLELDWDWMNESVASYVKSVASPGLFRYILERISSFEEWYQKLYLLGAIEDSEPFLELEDCVIQALSKLDDYDLQSKLICYLSLFTSSKALQVAEDWYKKNQEDPEMSDVAENLLTVYSLGLPDPAKIAYWKTEVIQFQEHFEERRRNSPLAQLQREMDQQKKPKKSAPVRPEQVTGRNEACPCGSGMKFKKCCQGQDRKIAVRGGKQ